MNAPLLSTPPLDPPPQSPVKRPVKRAPNPTRLWRLLAVGLSLALVAGAFGAEQLRGSRNEVPQVVTVSAAPFQAAEHQLSAPAPWPMQLRRLLSDHVASALLACACVALLGWPRRLLLSVSAGYTLFMILLSFLHHPMAVNDEGGHFAYTQHIIEHAQTPLVTMTMRSAKLANDMLRETGELEVYLPADLPFYEAVQGPAYYAMSAAIGKVVWLLTGSWAAVFYALRAFGAALVGAGFYLLARSAALIGSRARQFLGADTGWGEYAALAILACCPMFLTVFSTYNNDQLAFTLGCAIFYALLVGAQRHGLSLPHIALLGALCGALWLTKMTGLVIAVICLPYVVFSSRSRLGPWLFCGLVAAMVVPLHMHWYRHYHALTGIDGHMEFIRSFQNPTNARTPLFDLVKSSDNYFTSFLVSYGRTLDPARAWAAAHLSWLAIAGIGVAGAGLLARFRQTWRQLFVLRCEPYLLQSLALGAMLLPCVMCILTTHEHGIDVRTSRYALPFMVGCMASITLTLNTLRIRLIAKAVAVALMLTSLWLAAGFAASLHRLSHT